MRRGCRRGMGTTGPWQSAQKRGRTSCGHVLSGVLGPTASAFRKGTKAALFHCTAFALPLSVVQHPGQVPGRSPAPWLPWAMGCSQAANILLPHTTTLSPLLRACLPQATHTLHLTPRAPSFCTAYSRAASHPIPPSYTHRGPQPSAAPPTPAHVRGLPPWPRLKRVPLGCKFWLFIRFPAPGCWTHPGQWRSSAPPSRCGPRA